MSKETPKYNYGFLLTTYNDSDQAVEAYKSLKESIPAGESYQLVIVDGGSKEEHLKVIQSEVGAIDYTHPDLSSGLTGGIYRLLGYNSDGSNIKEFIKSGISAVDYIIWIHTDMRFGVDSNFANKLCFCYEYCYPMFGRLAPGTSNIDGSHPDKEVLRLGNNCPWVASAKFFREFIAEHGYVYNPSYIRIGSAEDFDMNMRMSLMGYGFGICSLVDVWHQGAGIRFAPGRDTVKDQIYNRGVFEKFWGEFKEPGCQLDLTEINVELRKAFEETFEDRWYDREKK